MTDVLVILDTNALHDDPRWSKPAAGKLLALARRGLVRVAVPRVVLLELERQRGILIANKLESLKATPKKVEAALGEVGVTGPEAGVVVPSRPTISADDLMRVYQVEMEALVRDIATCPAAPPAMTTPHDDLHPVDLPRLAH